MPRLKSIEVGDNVFRSRESETHSPNPPVSETNPKYCHTDIV